jgi:hypothetical protein
VQSDLKSETAQNQIAEFFDMELLNKGYEVLNRTDAKALLKGQRFEASDLATQEGAARAGRMLNAPAVLVVNIPDFGQEISMTAKIIEVDYATILWMDSATSRRWHRRFDIFTAAARGKDDQTPGVAAADASEDVAGGPLLPQDAEKARKMIEKMCRSLPPRQADEQ